MVTFFSTSGHTVQSMPVFLWHRNGVRRCHACASGLRWSQDRGWVVSRCNQAKTKQQYLLCGTAKQASRLPRLSWNLARLAYAGCPPIGWAATWSKSIVRPASYRLQSAYAGRSQRNAPNDFDYSVLYIMMHLCTYKIIWAVWLRLDYGTMGCHTACADPEGGPGGPDPPGKIQKYRVP